MPYYERNEIRAGIFMELDAPVDITPRRAPRYGDPPDPIAISARLDEIRARLEKLRTDLRAARK